jgi:hypothetical protein
MKFFTKILGAAVVATLATSVVASPAFAHNPNNYKAPGGAFPTLLGPIGAAALFPSTSTFFWTTTQSVFSHKNYFIKIFHQWHQVPKVKYDLVKLLNQHLPSKLDVPIKKEAVYKDVKTQHSKSSKNVGKAVVGCIFGSALGAITASVRKASAMGNPPRWRSQAEHERIVASGYEKQFEMTTDEAMTATALCGLGSFALHWPQRP